MTRFCTLVQGLGASTPDYFVSKMGELVNDGWTIVSSGNTNGMFWAILSQEY